MKYLGIDVAKDKLDCALLDPAADRCRSKVVANSPAGVQALVEWLIKQGAVLDQLLAVLEATGVYHEVAALALIEAGIAVAIVNPARVKDFARALTIRTKTDAVDRVVLARFGQQMQPTPWQPPPAEVRELTALLDRLAALEKDQRREQNRLEKAQASQAPALIQESLAKSLEFLKAECTRLQELIDDHIDRHPTLKTDCEHLQSIPGVGNKTAPRMLAVLRSRPFDRAEQVAAYLGLVPVEHHSGSSVQRRPRLSKAGNPRLRAMLYMAAVVAKQYNPHVKALYDRLLARGKCKMAALGAAMRKLVHLCYGVLKHQQDYQADWKPKTA